MFMEEVHAKETELNKHCLIMGQVRSWQPAVPFQQYSTVQHQVACVTAVVLLWHGA
jgi:hypothetical protein